MNEKIKRIHDLLEELADAAREAFPEYSSISAFCGSGGYRTIEIIQVASDEKTPEKARWRKLLDQAKIQGEWTKDRSADQNQYYDMIGVLLKDDCVG